MFTFKQEGLNFKVFADEIEIGDFCLFVPNKKRTSEEPIRKRTNKEVIIPSDLDERIEKYLNSKKAVMGEGSP